MLEKVEFTEQKPVEEDHVIGFVDRKDQYKAQKELDKGKTASEAIPDGDRPHTQYRQYANDHQYPSRCPGAIEQLFISGL